MTLKRGKIDIGGIDCYLNEGAPAYAGTWTHVKEIAAREK